MFFPLARREWCRLLHTHKFIWTKTCKQCGRLKPLLSSTSGAQEMWKSVGASDGHREREGVNRRNIERRVQKQRGKGLEMSWSLTMIQWYYMKQHDYNMIRYLSVGSFQIWRTGEKERLEASFSLMRPMERSPCLELYDVFGRSHWIGTASNRFELRVDFSKFHHPFIILSST